MKVNRLVLALGASLAFVGSFLPWTYFEGFAATTPINGIEWSPGWYYPDPQIEDHGGLLIVLLSLVIVVLVFHAPRFVTWPAVAALVCATALALVSTYHVVRCYLAEIQSQHIYDAKVFVGPGVNVVFLGSLTMFWATFKWKKSIARH